MRSRLLRPGLYTNEQLARLSNPDKGKLLFAGLTLLADRAGRLEDRPARIRAELFAYEPDLDVDPLLDELAGGRFISRYVGPDGTRCIHITKFLVHQTPHIKEARSILPPPPDPDETLSKNDEHQPFPGIPGNSQKRSPCTVSISVPISDPVSISDPGSVPVSVQDQDQDQPAAPVFSNADDASLVHKGVRKPPKGVRVTPSQPPARAVTGSPQRRRRAAPGSVNGDAFTRFWTAYPRKAAREDARKAFTKLAPDEHLVETMLDALNWQRQRPDWHKHNGQYVPHAATWLRGRRWEDARPEHVDATDVAFDEVMRRHAERSGGVR